MEETRYEKYEGYKMADYADQLGNYLSVHVNWFDSCGWNYERVKALAKELDWLYLYLSNK